MKAIPYAVFLFFLRLLLNKSATPFNKQSTRVPSRQMYPFIIYVASGQMIAAKNKKSAAALFCILIVI